MNDLAAVQQKASVLASMAREYGVEPKALEITLRKTVMPQNHTDEEFCAFCIVANKYQLNPMIREIYAFPKKGGGIQAIVSIDGWISLVNRQAQFDGVEFADQVKDGQLEAVTCTMFRKDRTRPIVVKEYLKECRRSTDPWAQMPYRMLRHKAFMQAARLAFGFAGLQDEDDAERAIEMTPDGNVIPDVSVSKVDLKRFKSTDNPERRSSNDDNFAKTKEQVNALPVAAPTTATMSTPVTTQTTVLTPAPAATDSKPATAGQEAPAADKPKRGRPKIAKTSPGGAAPAAPAEAEAPAPLPAPAAKEEPPEPGSVEEEEKKEPELANKAGETDEGEDFDDLDDGDDVKEDDSQQTDTISIISAKIFTEDRVDPKTNKKFERFELKTADGRTFCSYDGKLAVAIANKGMDRTPAPDRKLIKSNPLKVNFAKDGDKNILLGLAE